MANDEEGGFEYTDMDEKVAQEKMTERHAKSQKEEDETVTLEELDDEPVRLPGGDDEWEMSEEGADLEYTADDKEEKEEKEEVSPDGEKEEKVETEKKLTPEEEADKKAMDEVIHHLDADGGGTKYKIKGKEYDVRDLTPQEFKDRFSKAGRFYEAMEELANERKQVQEKERLAEEGARRSQEIMEKYGGGKPDEVKIPTALKVLEDDPEDVRALKEMNAQMYTELQGLKTNYQQQAQTMTEQELFRQLDTVTKEFPMASKEEIVAVKYNYPDADLRTIAERSHNNRISDPYIDAVLDARPERLREIREKAIEEYLAKKQQVTKVSRKKSSTTVSSKASSAKKRTPRTFDEIEAQLDNVKRDMSSFDED